MLDFLLTRDILGINDMSSTDYYKDAMNSELVSLLASKSAFNRDSKEDYTTFTTELVEDRTKRYSENFPTFIDFTRFQV